MVKFEIRFLAVFIAETQCLNAMYIFSNFLELLLSFHLVLRKTFKALSYLLLQLFIRALQKEVLG